MDEIINNTIKKECTTKSVFDLFIEEILNYYNKPVHSLQEMNALRRNKVKGDIWEMFCLLYLKCIEKYDNVWLLKDIPDDLMTNFGLNKRDMGIDIIVEKNKKYSAVQCKFKKPRLGTIPGTYLPYSCVNWSELSTFYSLCSRTNNNNWEKHIVMTNVKSVKRMGQTNKKDKSYCTGSFNKIKKMDLINILKYYNEYIINNNNIMDIDETMEDTNTDMSLLNIKEETTPTTLEELREARLKYFDNRLL